MVKLGLSQSDEPTTFSDEELVKYFGSVVSFDASIAQNRYFDAYKLYILTGDWPLLWKQFSRTSKSL